MNKIEEFDGVEMKQQWVRPELQRIEAGSAESAEGNVQDGPAPNQAS